jgi:hypothetical protein
MTTKKEQRERDEYVRRQERRATVERIQDAMVRHNLQGTIPEQVFAILDEEAAYEPLGDGRQSE